MIKLIFLYLRVYGMSANFSDHILIICFLDRQTDIRHLVGENENNRLFSRFLFYGLFSLVFYRCFFSRRKEQCRKMVHL